MTTTWKVVWKNGDGVKTFKRFNDPSPQEAIAFGKELKRKGLNPAIISANKPWPPTKKQEENRRPGDLWCPYCIRWKRFKLFALRKKNYVTEAFLRCPTCTISTNDFWVKKYNGMIENFTEAELIRRLTRDG